MKTIQKVDQSSLERLFDRIYGYRMPTFRMQKLNFLEALGEAFEQINKEGKNMTQEELFFLA